MALKFLRLALVDQTIYRTPSGKNSVAYISVIIVVDLTLALSRDRGMLDRDYGYSLEHDAVATLAGYPGS